MSKTLYPLTALRELLVRQGHDLKGDVEGSTDISLTPESIVTVALNLDSTLKPAFRERYFVTLVDRDDYKPLLRNHPDFTLPEPFSAALDEEPIGGRQMIGNFLLGPSRWLIRRLARFPRLLLWPEQQIRESDGFMRDRWVLEDMPELSGWLEKAGTAPPNAGAMELDPADIADCRSFGRSPGKSKRVFTIISSATQGRPRSTNSITIPGWASQYPSPQGDNSYWTSYRDVMI